MDKQGPIVYSTLPLPGVGITDQDTLIQTLRHPDMDKVSHCTVERPKGGEVYVFQLSSLRSPHDIKCDLYTWKQTSTYHFPKSAPIAERRYYAIVVDREKCFAFKRIIVTLKGSCDFAMVQYIGNEKVYIGHVHGNSKSQNREYIRESPSVKDKVTKKGDDQTTSAIYRGILAKSENESIIYLPRNPKKVENIKGEARRSRRLTHDAIYNVRELSFHLPQFVQSFNIAPDIVLHLVYTPLLDVLNDVLGTANLPTPTFLCYDTTFELGDFYVSTLSFRHSLLDGAPVIPIAFLIHDRKFQRDHQMFIECFLKLINHKRIKGNVAFVTDREFDFQRLLPKNMFHVYCWNHLKRNARDFVLHKTNGKDKEKDARTYVDLVHQLLSCASENEYLVKKDVEMRKWSQVFVDYFNDHLDQVIRTRSGRWVLEQLGMYTVNSGITTNCAESLNAVLHRLQLWNERPLDVVVFTFFEFCKFFQYEIKRALHGIGKFTLHDHFKPLPIGDLPDLPITLDPENIVNVFKKACEEKKPLQTFNIPDTTDAIGDQHMISMTDTAPMPFKSTSEEISASKCMAQKVLDEGRVTFVPAQKAFLVEGSDSKKFAVTLFPKQECQCPATKTCYHIRAAMMYIGGDLGQCKPGRVNLQQLSKRSRNNADKRSGRKRPRTFDYDIVAAPDSLEAQDGVTVRCVSSKGAKMMASAEPMRQEPLERIDSAVAQPKPPIIRVQSDDEIRAQCTLRPTSIGVPELLKWGSCDGTMSNTCSIDNLLSLCFIAFKQSPLFAQKLKMGTSNAERNLDLVMTLMDASNLDAAKKCWIQFLQVSKAISASTNGHYDLWGSETENFVLHFRPVFGMIADDICEHEDTCPRPTKVYKIGVIAPENEPLQSAINSITTAFSVECKETVRVTTANRHNTKKATVEEIDDDGSTRMVKTTECSGLRNVYDFRFENDNVFLLPLHLRAHEWTVQDAMALPEVINVLSKTFYLRGFTVSLAGHFAAYVWWNGKYCYYDGLIGGTVGEEIPTALLEKANFALYTI